MIRCYFAGGSAVFESDLDKKIAVELEKMVQLDDEIEFWFYNPCYYKYDSLCLYLAIWLRTKYPNKSIKIIRRFSFDSTEDITVDYNANASANMEYYFPRCMVDKNINISYDNFISKLCNYLFYYDYPTIYKKAPKLPPVNKKNTTIIHLACAETEALIQKTVALLSEQEQFMLQMLKEGRTQISIAQTIGLSNNTTRLKINDAYRKLYWLVQRAASVAPPFSQGVCALIGLDNPSATSTRLTLFECMMEYLFRQGIDKFWIDEDSLQTSYGVILARTIINYGNLKGSKEKPTLEIFPNTLQGYKEAIQQSQWVLTDYAHSQAETIKTLCSEDGRTLLVDLVSDKRTIEKMSF